MAWSLGPPKVCVGPVLDAVPPEGSRGVRPPLGKGETLGDLLKICAVIAHFSAIVLPMAG